MTQSSFLVLVPLTLIITLLPGGKQYYGTPCINKWMLPLTIILTMLPGGRMVIMDTNR